jgi:hypothetical protein
MVVFPLPELPRMIINLLIYLLHHNRFYNHPLAPAIEKSQDHLVLGFFYSLGLKPNCGMCKVVLANTVYNHKITLVLKR